MDKINLEKAQELIDKAQNDIIGVIKEVKKEFGLVIKEDSLDIFINYFNGSDGFLRVDNFLYPKQTMETILRLSLSDKETLCENEDVVKSLVQMVECTSYNKVSEIVMRLNNQFKNLGVVQPE